MTSREDNKGNISVAVAARGAGAGKGRAGWGGYRPGAGGAGRPRINPTSPMSRIAITLPLGLRERAAALGKGNVSHGIRVALTQAQALRGSVVLPATPGAGDAVGKMVKIAITLTSDLYDVALSLGAGNASAGIRWALENVSRETLGEPKAARAGSQP